MLNSWTICGRMTKDPDVRTTPSGVAVLNITLAVDRDYKNGDEKLCDFIPVVLWRNNAEYIGKYAKKGDFVAVAGSGEISKWQDKDGNERYITELIAKCAYILGGRKEQSPTESAPSFAPVAADDGDLPF